MLQRAVPITALLVALAAPAGANTITASWQFDQVGSTYGTFGGASNVAGRGQVFTAGTGGKVISAGIRIGRSTEATNALRVSIFAADESSLPAGDPIITQDFPGTSVIVASAGAPTVFTFTNSGGALEGGRDYVMTLESAGAENFFLNGKGGADATYERDSVFLAGFSWSTSATTDWPFQVIVDETSPVEGVTWSRVKALF